MELRPLSPDRAAVRRYVEALWLPYQRELASIVDEHALAGDVDVIDQEVDYRLDRLGEEHYRAWVAVDAPRGEGDGVDLAADGELVGFVTTDVDEAPSVFDRPDRLIVGDLYVREPYRGTDLARELIDRAAARAREAGCGELALDVDVENGRAVAFYERLGFETRRHRMVVGVDEL